jgi:hypothetical protein
VNNLTQQVANNINQQPGIPNQNSYLERKKDSGSNSTIEMASGTNTKGA